MNGKIKGLLETAWSKRREDRPDQALILLKEAQSLCNERDYEALGRIFHIYAQLESDRGNHPNALEFIMQSVKYYRASGNKDKIAHSTRHLADIQFRNEMFVSADHNYRLAIQHYREDSAVSNLDLANALRGYALLLEKNSRTSETILTWQEVKTIYSGCSLQDGINEANDKLNELTNS